MVDKNETPETNKTSSGMQENVAGLLCYVLWWVTGVIFLIIEKDNKFIRFHAFQSIFTFGAITIIQIILAFIPIVGWILGIIIWILSVLLWIYCMMKAYQGSRFKLPIVGDIAENQVNR
jgi:uncharacterized membrane protein